MQLSEGVKNLLILNGIFWLATMVLLNNFGVDLALHFPTSPGFQPYQVVTSMFAHLDFSHLLWNMITLIFIGPFVEMMLGTKRFIIFYLICGLGATAIHVIMGFLLNQHFGALGASGATSGLLIFFVIYFWDRDVNLLFIPFAFKGWMLFVLFFGRDIYNVLVGAHTGISHWAHLGGALIGFIYVQWWRRAS